MWTEIPLQAQVVKDESELAAKPFYINATNMRSVNGKMETTYGQELVNASPLTGVCRGSLSWTDLNSADWAAFGTHLRLQVIDVDGVLYDITPVITRGQLTNPFTVSSGIATVSVHQDSHGLVVDQKINFPNTSSAGDITISGAYTVSTINSSSSYGFTASSIPSISTAGVGGTVDYEYSLAPGNLSNLGGLGFGVGAYGIGGFGAPSAGQNLDARTWSFAQWGQNLIANPNWGEIYEWAPNTSASEIINTGNFSSSGTWVFGSGWSLGAGVASAASADALTQAVSLVRSSWHLLQYTVTRNSGTITALIGTSTIGNPVSAAGTYKTAFFSPSSTAQTLKFDGSHTFNGTLDNVSLKVLTTATKIDNSPSSAGSVFVTAERNLVACGATSPITGLLAPMDVRWSAQENNQDWTASAANVAGRYPLSYGSRIVRGMAGNKENLIFTDTAVYRMRSVPDPTVVYAFDLIGEGCGLIGPNAVVQVNGVFFWVTPQGVFMMYNGGLPIPLPNPSSRDFNDNLADVQGSKIYAFRFTGKNEVGFIYPDERDGIECSRLHRYNFQDLRWVSGPFAFTSFLDAGVYPFPLATDANGYITYQEKDFSNDGSARATLLESSYFNIGDGQTWARIDGFRPDFDDLRGGAQITFYSKDYPQGTERTYGPYNVTAATKRVSLRIKGRQLKYKIETNDAPTFYRVGSFTFDLYPSGQKK